MNGNVAEHDCAPPWATDALADYRGFYDTAPCGYVTLLRDGTILGANRTLLGWIGRDAEGPPRGLALRDILTAPSWIVVSMKCLPVLAMHGEVREIALDLRRADGAILPVLATFQRGDDTPLIRGLLFDVRERRLYERELLAARRAAEEAGARLSAVLEATTDGVLLVGSDWRVAYVNRSAARFLPAARVGTPLHEAFPSPEEGAVHSAVAAAMDGATPEPVQERLGAETWLSVAAHPAPGGGVAVFFRDVTLQRQAEAERQRAADRIAFLASHDALTGLHNRSLFATRLRAALAETDGRVAVLCLDLDRFKQVNDRLGHAAGDALLKAVAGRLRSGLRPEDMAARFGGDEFAVVLASAARFGPPDREAAARSLAARIIQTLSAPYALGGEQAEIGASVGITLADGRDADPDRLLQEADLALYAAKRAGRGRHAVFRPAMMEEQRFRLELGDALRLGLQRGELRPHYQPAVDVATRSLRGYEALLRWERPGHGLVSPAAFMAAAEETGLIVPLGAMVLDQACRDAAAWPDRRLRVAVNLAPLELRDDALVDRVVGSLDRAGLAPERLELEITEGVLLDRTELVQARMKRLRGLGVTFALDDFGTGSSSLASLRDFPFGRVKIDGTFVRQVEGCDADAAVVEYVAGLARRLGMACTAEGVESEGQFRLVTRAGCTEAQGYAFGRPVEQAELLGTAEAPGGREPAWLVSLSDVT